MQNVCLKIVSMLSLVFGLISPNNLIYLTAIIKKKVFYRSESVMFNCYGEFDYSAFTKNE